MCYVSGTYGTIEVSNGTLKINLKDLGYDINCDNWDKCGSKHWNTRYVSARICTKNRFEASRGCWTARLRINGNQQWNSAIWPAWWILQHKNNEPPVDHTWEPENVAWPLKGSGEIDIWEHFGNGNTYDARVVRENACGAEASCPKPWECSGDWGSFAGSYNVDVGQFQEYSVDFYDAATPHIDLRCNGNVFKQFNHGSYYGGNYFDYYKYADDDWFGILNFAMDAGSSISGTITMEVDWVKHETYR